MAESPEAAYEEGRELDINGLQCHAGHWFPGRNWTAYREAVQRRTKRWIGTEPPDKELKQPGRPRKLPEIDEINRRLANGATLEEALDAKVPPPAPADPKAPPMFQRAPAPPKPVPAPTADELEGFGEADS